MAAEKEWSRVGYPDDARSASELLDCGCCHVAFRAIGRKAHDRVYGIAWDELGSTDDAWYLAPEGREWSARIMWLYVMALAVEEARA